MTNNQSERNRTELINKRMDRLRDDISDYTAVKDTIATGIDRQDEIAARKAKIMKVLGASEEQWNDYRWQLSNRITSVEEMTRFIDFGDESMKGIQQVADTYRFAISPYYLSLINPEDPHDPIRRQSVPCIDELLELGKLDPMDEAGSSPVPGVTRRYPDRLIIKITNQCGMYCRFCQRRRLIGEEDHHTLPDTLKNAVEYIRQNPEIRDVLLTGGDALMLSDAALDRLLTDLRTIPHVEIIRLGTRTPVTLPQRITPDLVEMLKKHHPIYVNTHFNSPAEVTVDSKRACDLLANNGFPLGNQMVLLAGVNDDPFIVRKLNQQLLKLRVRPYYIFHPKQVRGTSHFWVNLETGMEIIQSLRGFTSGLAIPTYIVNGTGGLGKTPMIPNYMFYIGKDKAVFRNWQGDSFEIENHPPH